MEAENEPSMVDPINIRWVRVLTLAAIGWYLLLIVLHYFNQRPLWNDEACVFTSIKYFTPAQMFSKPLDSVQQFPRMYLFLIQQVASRFDFSLLSLRFFPFICMAGAFMAWVYLSRDFLSKERTRLMFVLCWAASIPLIYYAAELKQYSMDVFAAGLFSVFISCQRRICAKNRKMHMLLLVLLPWLAAFSYMVFLMLVFPFFNICRMEGWRKNGFWVYVGSCLLVIIFVYWFDVRVGNGKVLRTYWQEYFISFDSVAAFFQTWGDGVNNLIARWFAEKPKWIRMAARFFMAFGLWQMFAGFWWSFKKDGYLFCSVATVALIVFVELVILGAFKIYAFTVPRTSLFFCPMLFLLAIQGMENLKQRCKWVLGPIQVVFGAYLLFVSIGIAREIFRGDLGAQSVIWESVKANALYY